MRLLFGGDYESALEEHMKDVPIGVSSSFAEDIFRDTWDKEHTSPIRGEK